MPKFRQFVIAIGCAPVQATLRAASATAIAPPVYGSRYVYAAFPSVVTAIAFFVPLMRSTAASLPGPATVFVPHLVVVLPPHQPLRCDLGRRQQLEQDIARLACFRAVLALS